MSTQTVDRRVVLGGETRSRGIIGGSRTRIEWLGLIATGAPAFLVLMGGGISWGSAAGAILVLALAFAVWTPVPGAFLRDRSAAAFIGEEISYRAHRRPFTPRHLADDKARHPYVAPVAVGQVRVLSATLPTGEELAILRHTSPGRRHFYSAAVEMAGPAAGLDKESEFGEAHARWGRFCAILARPGSMIRTVQEVTRVVPYDTRDHTAWVMDLLPASPDPDLTASYVELLDMVGKQTEQHRSWLVLRLPVTPAFTLAAREHGQGEDGAARLVAAEVGGALERAAAQGLRVRPLDERRLSAVIRSLQDADYPIDQVHDDGGPMSYARAWLPQDCKPRRHVVVQGSKSTWYTRTAIVPRTGITPGRLSPDFLHPLLSNVSPSVVRTIATTIDLVPAHIARRHAKDDVTHDRGASKEALGKVSDGSEDDQLTASQQRLADLKPSTGVHGANWAMSVTVTARDQKGLAAAVRQLEDAADEANITSLYWLDGKHAAGLITSLPLARGMEVRK
ncbi:SCO6880 family protein [Luteimicrobium sp. DT211]|uniref:SCO6880 family protein n=1 Tax=Luteimicrobium sp. DT211 TaxID=3393412 RepID=UPI003CFAF3B4